MHPFNLLAIVFSSMKPSELISQDNILTFAYQSLLSLITEDGINASGKEDVYGCIFGRDSAITILKILKAVSYPRTAETIDFQILLDGCRRALLKLTELQGTTVNMESGEEPGKFVHEYRTENYDRLLRLEKPWYVYPDNVIRNYDSIDSTPLTLIAIFRYYELTQDNEFLLKVLPAVEKGLNWIILYGDRDKDYLVEYELPQERQHGGLVVQSWTDSVESMLQENGQFPMYPIAPVEVQGYVWLALRLWADYYSQETSYAHTGQFAQKLHSQADHLKEQFNRLFLFEDVSSNGMLYAAQALDGTKQQIRTITGNPLLLLWASYLSGQDVECILERSYVPSIVQRSFLDDMFDSQAGIRTMSTLSPFFNPRQNSYHNGSFWPQLNGMAYEGLIYWGYSERARQLRDASLYALSYFGTPIELYVKSEDGQLMEFINESGQQSCREQAWSAATALDLVLSTAPGI